MDNQGARETQGAGRPTRRRAAALRPRHLITSLSLLTLALGAVLTIGATTLLVIEDRRADAERAEREVLDLAFTIELAVSDHLAALRGLAAYAAVSDGLDDDELARYAASAELAGVLPALHGFEWVPATDGRVSTLVTAPLTPATSSDPAATVRLATEPVRQTTAARALATNRPALSAPVGPSPGALEQTAVVVYDAVGSTDGALVGLAGVVLDLDRLLASLPSDVDRFELVDVATGTPLLEIGDLGDSATATDLSIHGRRWTLTAASDTGTAIPIDLVLVGLAGLVASAFLAMVVGLLQRWGDLAEDRAALLTVDLRRTYDDLETATSRLRDGMRSADVFLWERRLTVDNGWDRDEWWRQSNGGEFRGFYQRVHPEDRGVFELPLGELEVGTAHEVEYRLRNADGDYRWTLSRGVVIERGGERFVLGANIDVHDKRAALEQVRLLNERLEESNRSLREFTRVASHDLRAPLRAVRALAGFLREDIERELGHAPSDDLEHHLERIQDRIDRLDRLLDDLLVYARADFRHDITSEVDVAELITDVLATADARPGLTITTDVQAPVLLVSPTPLATCLRNLVDNAIKFHDRPDDGRICISATFDGDALEVAVVDDGPGIDPDYADRVWEPFRRLASPRAEQGDAPGTGIGLSVIRRMAQAHEATVTLAATPGGGATFTLRWPATAVATQVTPPVPTPPPATARDRATAPSGPARVR